MVAEWMLRHIVDPMSMPWAAFLLELSTGDVRLTGKSIKLFFCARENRGTPDYN
jgi:hypothetical protein